MDINTLTSPCLLTSALLIPAKLVGYINCKWEGQYPAVIAMDTWHGHTHIVHLGWSRNHLCVYVCVIVHVSEVGQQRRYLTHPEKTSGEQSSHWLQLTHTDKGYQSYTQSHLCCTCTGAHKNIWLNLWTHTKSQWTRHRSANTCRCKDWRCSRHCGDGGFFHPSIYVCNKNTFPL